MRRRTLSFATLLPAFAWTSAARAEEPQVSQLDVVLKRDKLIIGTSNSALGAVSVTGGSIQLGSSTGLATLTGLSISGGGTFDVNNNHIIINYGTGSDPIASIATLLKPYSLANFASTSASRKWP